MKIIKKLRNLDKFLGTAVLFMMIITVVVQIIMRFLGVPFIGTLEIAQYFMIFIVFISMSYTTRDGEHIRMPELQNLLPEKVLFLVNLLVYALAVIAFSIVFYSAVRVVIKNYQNVTPSLQMPIPIFFLPTVLGFFLLALEYLIKFIELFVQKKIEKPDVKEIGL